jgi:hypothetical protein
MSKEILSIDFDGVLHAYTSKWSTADVIPDPPVEGAVEFINEAVKHFKVVIHSVRCGYTDGKQSMYNWFAQYGFPADKLEYSYGKPAAVMYIDDRGYHFQGKFPSIEFIKNFETWNSHKKVYKKEE